MLACRLYSVDEIYLYRHLSLSLFNAHDVCVFHSVSVNNRQYIGKRRMNFVNELCEARHVGVLIRE